MLDQELLAKAEANDVQAILKSPKRITSEMVSRKTMTKPLNCSAKLLRSTRISQMCTVVLVDATKRAGVLLRI